MPHRHHIELDARARHLLRALIGQYVRDGQPVGSRTLARSAGLEVSAATIRNVMADLEELGLVTAPHTSAGRIPTAQGYRVFVDSLLELKPLSQDDSEMLRLGVSDSAGTQTILNNASELLSGVTHFVGLVTVPRREQFAFRHIDFVPLGGNRLLVILVFTDHEVQNRVVEMARPYATGELEQIANYLNSQYAGLPLEQIRLRLVEEMRQARADMGRLMASSIEVAEAALRVEPREDMLVAGQSNLLGVQEFPSTQRLRELFDAFARKQELLKLLDNCIHADGVRLFIGEESGYAPLGECSVVAAPYGPPGKVLGVLGVIGPTRMEYERVIPVVQATARIVTGALNRS
ncbi:MAG TPA: heat-inducible transcriptional repressor HrcA [Xanthomonadales bacterium]|nr:heat-inducible transcriptional repressor HrcA [Xanthomonadales bacterium]